MTVIFLGVSYALIALIYIFMPKRLSRQEVYVIWAIVSLLTLISDLFFGQLLDKYDLMHKPGPEFPDVLVEISLPAAFGILYLNFIPKEKMKFIVYLAFWVLLSVGYEQLSRYFGYVNYNGWKIWYSFVFYIFACLFMRWHHQFIRKVMVTKNDRR